MIKIENIGEYLKEHGIKPSYQRIHIFEYLLGTISHPTVDIITKALISDIPTLSKTTVYNTLKLFMEKGIVNIINIENNETRYDADISMHGHFKCKKCGQVYDFKIDSENLNFTEMENFIIDETHIYLKGMCNNCK